MNSIFRSSHNYIKLLFILISLFIIGLIIGNPELVIFGISEQSLLATVFGLYLIFEFSWLYVDYRQHKNPLLVVDPDVQYSIFHHIKQVTLPTMQYRWSSILLKKKQSPPK